MIKHLLPQKLQIISIIFIFIVSCGSDMVEDVVETYEFGDKKVYVRYHPDPNVLEKHIYNKAGEIIHLERDSLSYGDDFKHFMSGTWIMDRMTVDDDVMFEKDSIFNPQKSPNIYLFSDELTGSISHYNDQEAELFPNDLLKPIQQQRMGLQLLNLLHSH